MCGRTAQTRHAVALAANTFGLSVNLPPQNEREGEEQEQADGSNPTTPSQYKWRDNFNLSPGMDAMVFYKDKEGATCMDRKIWGLVTKPGTRTHPLPPGMGKHFEGLMFNARSDTLYQKPTFARLTSLGRSCIVAFDGFFEWKAPVGSKGKKQPYFVRSNPHSDGTDRGHRPFLLMAGLWNQVSTGWDEKPMLDTFTIITTEVCNPLRWLHSRMPVCIWDEKVALGWLDKPTVKIHTLMERACQHTPDGFLDWYPVTTDMSSTKFRSADALRPLPREKSVKDYFLPMGSGKERINFSEGEKCESRTSKSNKEEAAKKRRTPSATPVSNKKQKPTLSSRKNTLSPKKKGTIDAYFQPKPKKPP